MQKPGFTPLSLFALGVLGASVYLAILLISPLPPVPASAPAELFSAERALQDLEVIAREPHPMGEFPAHAAVRDYLLQEIRQIGLEPQVQDTIGLRVFSGAMLGGTVENILVRLPGNDPEGALLLVSHYDSTPGGPGGVDSGSGVVTILEILRALAAGPPLRQDVIVLFSDGEEPGLIGSNAFIAQHPWFQDVRYVLNMDQFSQGPPAVFRTNLGNGSLIQSLASTAIRPVYLSLPFHLFPSGDTDLVPFALVGVPGADIASGGNYPEKHTLLDRPELVDPSSLQLAGQQMLALVRSLGDQPSLERDIPDQTFFPILGRLVHYPTAWAIPLAVAAGVCFLGVVYYGFRRGDLTWGGLGIGFLVFILTLILTAGIANFVWLGIQALHPEYQYSSLRTHLSDDILYFVAFIFLALAVCTFLIKAARKRISAPDLAGGVLAIWFPGAVGAALFVPETSYLTSWVLLSGALALLWNLLATQRKSSAPYAGLGHLVSAILAIFLFSPVFSNAFLGASFPMLILMIGLIVLLLGSMMPVLDSIMHSDRWLFPAVSMFLSLGFFLAGHWLVGRESPPPLVNSIGYWMDAEEGQAYWIAFIGGYRTDAVTSSRYQVAFPEEMDERQTRLLADPIRRPYTDLFQEAPPYSVLTSAAPALDQDGPFLEVVDDLRENEHRLVRVSVTASLRDRLYVIIPGDVAVLSLTLPHNPGAEIPEYEDAFILRFDGMPAEGLEMSFEIDSLDPFSMLLVEEKTGLPTFPGLITQPEPGTMRSPGEFYQGDATDFTVINRNFVIPAAE